MLDFIPPPRRPRRRRPSHSPILPPQQFGQRSGQQQSREESQPALVRPTPHNPQWTLKRILSRLLGSPRRVARRSGEFRSPNIAPLRPPGTAAPVAYLPSRPDARPGQSYPGLRPAVRPGSVYPGTTPAGIARSDGSPTPLDPTGSPTQRRVRQHSQPRRPATPLVYVVRSLIVGIGVAAIAGTALSAWEPNLKSSAQTSPHTTQAMAVGDVGVGHGQAHVTALGTGREMTALGTKVMPLTQGLTDLTPGVFVADLDSGDYFTLNGETQFSAASMIKVPVLVAFMQDVDAGKIRLDDLLVMEQGDVADNSGDMQYSPVGTKYTALETATNMIVISDNTATNMLIRRLGGIEALNQRFRQWGLQETVLHNRLPDLTGTNTASPKELSSLLASVSQGELMSMKSRDRMLAIMRQTVTDTLLPTSLGEGATISHKTGDIGSMVGDTGLIDMPSGRRYVMTAMVKRPFNDDRAQELIRQIAHATYEYLDQRTASSPTGLSGESAAPSPAPSPEINVPTSQPTP